MVVAGTLAGAAVGLAAVYGISTLLGNRGAEAGCAPAVETAKRVAPFAHGEVAALAVASKPLRVPDLAFRDADAHRAGPAGADDRDGSARSRTHLGDRDGDVGTLARRDRAAQRGR